MRIGIDNISPGEATARGGPGGMRSYLQNLVLEFAQNAPNHKFILFTPNWAESLVDTSPPNLEIVSLPGVPRNRTLRAIYQQVVLPVVMARKRLDVFFATATVAPLAGSIPIVLAVQFTQFYKWPEAYGRWRTHYLKMLLPASIRKAAKAIIFTESAKQDLLAWTGAPTEKIDVVPHGLSSQFWTTAEQSADSLQFRAKDELTGGRPYLVYVSATYGYKNHARLIQAFGLLKGRLQTPHVLLLVGSYVTVSLEELRGIAQQSGVAEDVVFAGRLESVEQVIATYKDADLSVIPSLYETFGFPALEAMACGCPLVASDIASMSELCGGAAVLVNPLDPEAIASGMEKVLTNPELRGQLAAAGRNRARTYSWRRSAAETLQILEEVGGLSCKS